MYGTYGDLVVPFFQLGESVHQGFERFYQAVVAFIEAGDADHEEVDLSVVGHQVVESFGQASQSVVELCFLFSCHGHLLAGLGGRAREAPTPISPLPADFMQGFPKF